MRFVSVASVVLAWLTLTGCSTTPTDQRDEFRQRSTWRSFETGSTASLRGISAVDDQVAWTCGTGGTVLRTLTAGAQWEDVSVEGESDLDFRSVYALNEDIAMVLSAGSPARLFRTTNGGRYWSLVYEDTRPEVFYDAMIFDHRDFGMAFSDPIDNHLQLITTDVWGRSWQLQDSASSPATLPGEAGFAASNSGLAIDGDLILIGLGGETSSSRARIARSTDQGKTWSMITTPMTASSSAGIFSIAIFDSDRAVAVGGDYVKPERAQDHWALTTDGGRTWKRPHGPGPRGYRSSVAAFPALGEGAVLCAGPSGVDLSMDFGHRWIDVSATPWHALVATPDGKTMWMSGSDGRVGIIKLNPDRTRNGLHP